MAARRPRRYAQPVDDAGFAQIREAHERILDEVARLEPALGTSNPTSLISAVEDFLVFADAALSPHMSLEDEDLYPLLDRYLPQETGSTAAMRAEHETARSLLSLMRRDLERARAGAADAASALATIGQDLVALLRDHIRKEDSVVNPLLQRLLREGHRV
jgi:hemerythrin-like domain-containing protein